jgi:hypothetical protein
MERVISYKCATIARHRSEDASPILLSGIPMDEQPECNGVPREESKF